jgi:hypothetical protein
MDADDIAEPQRLELQYCAFEAQPALGVAGGQIRLVDTRGAPLGDRHYPTEHEQIVRALRRHNPLAHPSVMFRRSLVQGVGGYRTSDLYPVEDYELWCRLARSGARFLNLPEILLRYRIHAHSSKSQATKRTLRKSLLVKRMHWRGRLDCGDRLRIALERLLLLLPAPLIHRLFLLSATRRQYV